VPVKLKIDRSSLNIFFDSEIMNLSKGGVFIRADITMPPGSEIDFDFTLPKTKKRVLAKGIVIWSRSIKGEAPHSFPLHARGMGIQFKDIALTDIEAILDEIDLWSK